MSTSGRSKAWNLWALLDGVEDSLKAAETSARLAFDFATSDEGATYRVRDVIGRLSEMRARVADEKRVARELADRKALDP